MRIETDCKEVTVKRLSITIDHEDTRDLIGLRDDLRGIVKTCAEVPPTEPMQVSHGTLAVFNDVIAAINLAIE